MGGTGPIPDFVEEGVAEEAAVMLGWGVSEAWLNQDSMPSDYITRRFVSICNVHATVPSNANFVLCTSHSVL